MPASHRSLFIPVALAAVTSAASVGWSAGRGATAALHTAAPGESALASASVGHAADHRKQIFDERRARYLESRTAQPAQASVQAHATAVP